MRANLNLWLADCILRSERISICPLDIFVADSPGRVAVERMSVAPNVFTPATPPLVQSPASSISSATSISSFDLDDGERTDIGDPLPQNLDAWFDSAAPASKRRGIQRAQCESVQIRLNWRVPILSNNSRWCQVLVGSRILSPRFSVRFSLLSSLSIVRPLYSMICVLRCTRMASPENPNLVLLSPLSFLKKNQYL